MAVVARKGAKKTVYWVATRDESKKQHWERVGTDKRAAEALNRRRMQEVKDGTFERGVGPSMTFGVWLKQWADKRANRNAADDLRLIERFLLNREWLCKLKLDDMRPSHTQRLVEELKVTLVEDKPNVAKAKVGKPISQKYVSNVYGLYCTACRAARKLEIMPHDPCHLDHGTIRRGPKRGVRINYEIEDVLVMSTCPVDEALVFAMLALLTGMRQGEVCGRRWRDWDDHSMPLGCLNITTQYDDQPLKTESNEGGDHPRKAPVHPELAKLLRWWWSSGFEFTYCRKPTRDDFIVPRTMDGKPHTRSSSYKLWRQACRETGVKNRSLHSTRHTFLTLTARGGAMKEVREQITHNARGDMVDHYTHYSWAPLCEAVMCLQLPVDSQVDTLSDRPSFLDTESWRRWESKCAPELAADGNRRRITKKGGGQKRPELPEMPPAAAGCCASQRLPTDAHTAEDGSPEVPSDASAPGRPAWVHEATANLYSLLTSAPGAES